MKDIFPGYSKKNESQIKEIWEKGVIIFDANVLLNLYRYSKETRETILGLIEKFKDRIWLPHQSALEYNRNRYEVIADQEKAYKEFTEKITQIQTDLQSTSKPPFLSSSVHQSLNKVFVRVTSEVEESIKKYCDYLKEDPIYDSLSNLFANKITDPYDEKRLTEIYEEGEERYKLKIPPGFEDEKNKDGSRKYGDLILWKQVIDKAIEQKCPVIFITDERKIDWWWKIKDGRNMGPRQELVEEVKKEANVDFHMYSSERFLSYGQNFLEEKVNQKALEEIQAMKKSEMEHIIRLKRRKELALAEERNFDSRKKLNLLRHHYENLTHQIDNIEQQQNDLRLEAEDNMEVQEFIHNLSIQLAELEEERNRIRRKLDRLMDVNWKSQNEKLHSEKRMDYDRYLRYKKGKKD